VLSPGSSCEGLVETLGCEGTLQQKPGENSSQELLPSSSLSGPVWGFVEAFDRNSNILPQETDLISAHVGDSGLVLAVKAPSGFDGYMYDAVPTEGRDIEFSVDSASADGWGEVSLVLRSQGGGQEWLFSVDPVAQEWSLYRVSDATSEFFYWVEPRPYASIAPGPLRTIAVRVSNGVPALAINDEDVVKPSGIAMPEMPENLVVGFGAGINPYSLTGGGQTFTVTIERAQLRER
jgi:hypothetical protein